LLYSPHSAFVLSKDRSVLNTRELRPGLGLLLRRHFVLVAARRLLRARLVAPRTATGLLQLWCLTLRDGLRLSPYADTLHPWYRLQIALRSTPKLRTVSGLLQTRHLAFRSVCGYLRSLHSTPCVDCGCLHSQPFELCLESVAPDPLLIALPRTRIASGSTLGT